MNAPAFSEADLVASICRESFEDFVREFWDVIIAEPLQWNWHMTYLCEQLQAAAERVFAGQPKECDLIINISPGTSKSTIVTIMFPAWCWTRMPSLRAIGASYAAALSLDHARKGREVIRSEKYQAVFRFKRDERTKQWVPSDAPDAVPLTMKGDQDLKSHYENQAGGARYAVGVGGAVTGMHGHILIVDDPLNPEEAASEQELHNASRWMSETLPTRKVDKEVAFTVLVMQRLHQADPTGHLIEGEDPAFPTIRHIKIPGELAGGLAEVKPPELRRFYIDGLMDPVRLSRKVLDELKSPNKLGEYGFAGQILQEPVPPGGGQFKVNQILELDPPLTFVKRVRVWDKAASAKKGDWSVGTLMGKDEQGLYWILDVIRGQWDTFQRELEIVGAAERDTDAVYIKLEQEPGSGGVDSTKFTMVALAGFRIVVEKPTGSKEDRAVGFSAAVNGGIVRCKKGAHWIKAWKEELKFFPFGLHDDQVDTGSSAFNFLTDRKRKVGGLGKSVDKAKVGFMSPLTLAQRMQRGEEVNIPR